MGQKIRVWFDDDRTTIHHAEAAQADGMEAVTFLGTADCGAEGTFKLVHHENVDMAKLCAACQQVSGVRPQLAGDSYGPV